MCPLQAGKCYNSYDWWRQGFPQGDYCMQWSVLTNGCNGPYLAHSNTTSMEMSSDNEHVAGKMRLPKGEIRFVWRKSL